MKRIGTTTDGGMLVELSALEVNRLGEAHELIGRLVFDLQSNAANPQPAAAISVPAARPARQPRRTDGTKTCTECGETKPVGDFYTGHGKCKPCTLARQNAKKATAQTGTPRPAANVETPKTKTCQTCKRELPKTAFHSWQRTCKECKSKSGSIPKTDRLALIRAADRKAKAAPREHDPVFDRPVDPSGRVLPVGGEG